MKIFLSSFLALLCCFALNLWAFIDDPHSQSNFHEVEQTHLSLSLKVDFEKKVLHGYAEISINNKNADFLYLDTENLNINLIYVKDAEMSRSVAFKMAAPQEHLGSRLEIPITRQATKVTIFYETSPNSRGLQWLSKEQTSSKQMPFVYTQLETNRARSVFPCQDSPQVRFTYDAAIVVPTGMMAVMSAA